ncbi:MAG TPA: hypothetical protein VGF97_12525 [Rhizomicrobium sp.]|jgi:uncharacterized membrane protein YgcG
MSEFGRRVIYTSGVVLACLLGGCTPSFELFNSSSKPNAPGSPTVRALVQHVTCELVSAINKHSSSNDQWRLLKDNHFMAAIDLTLYVTQSEGFDPSAGIIDPLTANGKALHTTPGASGQPSASNSLSLSFGFQLNASQDRNFDLDYALDLHDLTNDANPGIAQACAKIEANGGATGINGDLKLEEIIDDGLDAAADYPNYSSETSLAHGNNKYSAPEHAVPAKSAKTPGQTSFSSLVDFTVLEGANGGPSLSLLHFRVGSASGGGGGGSGSMGGSGSSGGGSGGGSGSGQIFSASRSTTDTLNVTFTATCREDEGIAQANLPVDAITQRNTVVADGTIALEATIRFKDDNGPTKLLNKKSKPIIDIEIDNLGGLFRRHMRTATGFIYITQPSDTLEGGSDRSLKQANIKPNKESDKVEGSVTWSSSLTDHKVLLTGVIANENAGNPIGHIALTGTIQGNVVTLNKVSSMSSDLFDRLQNDDRQIRTYLADLPICNSPEGAASTKEGTKGAGFQNTLNKLEQLRYPLLQSP